MESLKANDLRIGNYIMAGNNGVFDKEGTIGKVLEIGNVDRDFEQIYCECEESFEWFFKNNYFGVPITEEWLLNFGFTKSTNDNSEIIDWIIWNELGISRFVLKILYENDGYVSRGVEYRIRYIHQLQNLFFALTGEELTLKQK